MDELWKQVVIGFSGIILALVGLVPAFLRRAQERKTMEDVQALARRALDVAGDALALLDRYLILESDADKVIAGRVGDLKKEYEQVWAMYRGRPHPVPEPDKPK